MFQTICIILIVIGSAGMTRISLADNFDESNRRVARDFAPILMILLPLLCYCLGVLHGGDQ